MLDKTYDPKNFEEKIYAEWEAAGDFKPNMKKQRSLCRRYSAAERYRCFAYGTRAG